MLKFLEIEGFKSFGSPNQKITLAPLTFVVGPNASGKTNLLNCLRFLQLAVMQDVEFAISQFDGIAEVRCKVQRKRIEPKLLRIHVSMDDKAEFPLRSSPGSTSTPLHGQTQDISGFEYSLAVDLRRSDDNPVIVGEELRCEVPTGSGRKSYRLHRDEHKVFIDDPTAPRAESEFDVPPSEHKRPAISAVFSLPASLFRKRIQDWSFYNISPHVARQSFREVPETKLGWSGENLSVILHRLKAKNGKGGLDQIGSRLRGAVPGFESVDAVPTAYEARWALSVKEEKAGVISPSGISDGTVRLLALMVAASLGMQSESVIAIEEPENGVHPHLSGHLVEILRETSTRTQVIATTHNPAFLDHLQPNEILLCAKQRGLTRVRHASDASELESFRKHFTLGELWVQGKLDFQEPVDE